jgi:hypothetical protein
MATNPKPPPTAKPNISPASNRLTPAEIEELREYHRQADIKIREALAAERARRAALRGASPIARCPSFKFLTMQMQPSASSRNCGPFYP